MSAVLTGRLCRTLILTEKKKFVEERCIIKAHALFNKAWAVRESAKPSVNERMRLVANDVMAFFVQTVNGRSVYNAAVVKTDVGFIAMDD